MRPLTTILAFGCLILSSCKRYEVNVENSNGDRLQNAHVYLSYDSDPRPPKFITDSQGSAVIPTSRASKGDWASIVVVYWDKKGTKYMGSLEESQPSWPVTIRVTQ